MPGHPPTDVVKPAFACAVLVLILAGCNASPPAIPEAPPCEHPYPCGPSWSLGSEFEVGPVLHFPVSSHDGIVLDGFVHMPKVADGTRVPVVLHSTPYPGTCPTNAAASCFKPADDPATTSRLNTTRMVAHGFAVAHMSVRGTGHSGGCFSMAGAAEQLDQVVLVDALAAAPWSNGRVAMMGHSYPSYTAWSAAVRAPAALKTIVASGHLNDLYTFYHTPQGLAHPDGPWFQAGYATSLGLPPLGGMPPSFLRDPSVRLCPDAKAAAQPMAETGSDSRDEDFWSVRQLSDEMSNVTAAVLLVSGFEDSGASLHSTQDDTLWQALRAPKRGLWGHWGHDLPPPSAQLERAPFGKDWHRDVLFPWLDYWLKGIGDPTALRLGIADYQDTRGPWLQSSAWPPAEARPEALYLAGNALATTPPGGSTTYMPAVPGVDPMCQTFLASAPADQDILIAGNVMALLQIESDQPRGTLALSLMDWGPEADCTSGPWPTIALAGADLRFLDGNFKAQPFPVSTATPVRLDFFNQAWTIEKGHRLVVMVQNPAPAWEAGSYASSLTLHGDGPGGSHLVLPVVQGTFGGNATGLDYPPRPFEAQ